MRPAIPVLSGCCVAAALVASAPAAAQDDDGWSLELTGRVQLAYTAAEADFPGLDESWNDGRVRRARIGVDGERGPIAFRAEVATQDDPLFDTLFWEDVWVTYDLGPFSLGVGQWKPPVTLEHQSSSRFILGLERSSLVEAFGFARRLGVQIAASGERYTFEAGLFGGNAANDEDATAEGSAAATRITFNPVLRDGLIVHLGASAQAREAEDGQRFRYRARPRIHLSDRFVDTAAFADEDSVLGAEAGVIAGRVHVLGEYGALAAEGPLAEADLSAGYLEAGFFLTPGDTLGYRGGLVDRTRPVRPVDQGGFGAWQLRGRLDHVDLADGAVAGGEQTSYSVGLNWFATGYVRVVTELTRADIENGPDGSGETESASVRAAFDW